MAERPVHDIEKKWQDRWEADGISRAAEKGDKFYGLIEFPYPSGEGLHVGHPRSYTAIDVVTRKKRMEGKNVLYPIGWDAFGLPTENFAIKNKVKPQDATAKNIVNFRRQLKSLGFGFDWSREVNTTDPKYYKWTQWQFLQFFKHGLAYKAKTTINWCPKDKIGLANEEVIAGCCERCGTTVEKREKEQWMIAITTYANRLLADLDTVDYLPQIKKQQQDWIGKSEGAYVDFVLENLPQPSLVREAGRRSGLPLKRGTEGVLEKIRVFTTRPDTLFGATFLVISPELAKRWIAGGWDASNEVREYVASSIVKAEADRMAEGQEKTGVATGLSAIHPVTGDKLPVWVADYVVGGYGTGAIMAVPAHDERDFAFAQKFGLPIRQVIEPDAERFLGCGVLLQDKQGRLILQQRDEQAPTRANMIAPFGGRKEKDDADAVACAIREMKEELELDLKPSRLSYVATIESHNFPGKFLCVFRVEGIDPASLIVHEGRGSVVFTPEEALAHERVTAFTKETIRALRGDGPGAFVEDGVAVHSDFLNGLPTWKAKQDMISWLEENEKGERAVTYKLRDWVFSRQRYWGEPIPIIRCEKCGYVPVPDKELPVELPSVEAYEPTDTGESPLAKIRDWVEVKCPSCGGDAERETDTMPNWAGSSWYFLRYCDPHNDKKFADPKKLKYWMPVDLYNGGMEHTTLHLLYSRFWYKFLWDIGAVPKECGPEPYKVRRSHGLILAEGGEKMSKSKGNVVNPDDVVAKYGADVFRVYEMFMGPFDQPVPWDTNGIEGVRRFLDKVWDLYVRHPREGGDPALDTLYHQTVKKITDGIETLQFNTCVSQMMILTNAYQDAGGVPDAHREGFLKILAPFAPHLAEELWETLGKKGSIHRSAWPAYDPSKTIAATFELVIQVNGKVRDRIEVSSDITEDEAKAKALASEKVQAHLHGKKPKQVVYVKGRLINMVI